MPTDSAIPLMQLPKPFSILLTDNPAHMVRFDQGQIYLGNRLLTLQDQNKFLVDYANAYRLIRRRNYGWRFLSSCHDYFNGQLQDIQQLKTDEEKIHYLFRHAEEKPESKTVEALRFALPLFCAQINNAQVVQQRASSFCVESRIVSTQNQTPHSAPKASQQATQRALEPAIIARSNCHDRYLRFLEDAFLPIWKIPSITKVASVQFEPRYSLYYLLFYDDCRAAIAKSNAGFFTAYNPFDRTTERETAEALWGKQLYDALDHFRRRVTKSDDSVKEIHNAFNDLIKQIHIDPPDLESGYVTNSVFHHAVIELRTKAIAIHNNWGKTVESEAEAPTYTALGHSTQQ
jgi:hypothetical protein